MNLYYYQNDAIHPNEEGLLNVIEVANVVFDYEESIQKKIYEGLSGKISFEFEITGKRAKKLMKQIKRLEPKKMTPFQYYGVRYKNLALRQKVFYKRLIIPNFNPKDYE